MASYTAITFSPVQGFIEKSRKLRDLYGASLILSYLSEELIKELIKKKVGKNEIDENEMKTYIDQFVISPALLNVTQGTPNRILLKGDFSDQEIATTLKCIWKKVLYQCKDWIETNCQEWRDDNNYLKFYYDHKGWEREWEQWKAHTWEIFSGRGESDNIKDAIIQAMNDLENNKLSRDWTGINWIGESSSITGTDAIAWYGLGRGSRNPNNTNWGDEGDKIADFYKALSKELSQYIDKNERLSIPELVKRLITNKDIAKAIQFELPQELRDQNFTDFIRKPQDNNYGKTGQWTGWFMGDGDKVGDYLIKLSEENDAEEKIKKFTSEMREWGQEFHQQFNQSNLGRVVYAGGDDFFGIIYNRNFGKNNKPENQQSISTLEIYKWLKELDKEWEK